MSVLQGPTDPEAFREWDGRKRMYIDPLETCPIAEATTDNWPSISAVKKASTNDWTSTMVKRMAKIPAEEWHRIAELPADARKDAMWAVNRHDLNVAAGRGTIIHAWCEDLLNGRPMREYTPMDLQIHDIPEESLPIAETYRAAVLDFFKVYDPELIATEYVAIHRTLNGRGYAGTPDGIWRLRKTKKCVAAMDYKTRAADSSHGVYVEEARQVAAGIRAEYMIVDDGHGGAKRARIPDVDLGMIVSIKPDGARVYPLDIDKAFEGFTKLHQAWLDKQEERDCIGRVWPVQRAQPESAPVVTEPQTVTESVTADNLVTAIKGLTDPAHIRILWAENKSVWNAELTELAKARVAELSK